MPQAEQKDESRVLSEFADEMASNRAPTREQWEAALGKWHGRVDIRPLLVYGERKGWIGDC
jgi:hypothetical protein